MPGWEAVDLIEQLLLDMGSHTAASIDGWAYPMTRGEMFDNALLTIVANMTRGKDTQPYVPDWPWPEQPKADDVTPEERTALKAHLQSKSAFGQKRTKGPTNV